MEVQGAISLKQLRDPCCSCHQHKDGARPLKWEWKKALSSIDSRALYKCLENVPGCQLASQLPCSVGELPPLPQLQTWAVPWSRDSLATVGHHRLWPCAALQPMLLLRGTAGAGC